jgi:hypothetical protein
MTHYGETYHRQLEELLRRYLEFPEDWDVTYEEKDAYRLLTIMCHAGYHFRLEAKNCDIYHMQMSKDYKTQKYVGATSIPVTICNAVLYAIAEENVHCMIDLQEWAEERNSGATLNVEFEEEEDD